MQVTHSVHKKGISRVLCISFSISYKARREESTLLSELSVALTNHVPYTTSVQDPTRGISSQGAGVLLFKKDPLFLINLLTKQCWRLQSPVASATILT